MDYLFKDNVDRDGKRIKQVSEIEEENKKKLNIILTYLSFVPLFGIFIGIYSLIKHINGKLRIITLIGIIFSLTLTVLMILGFTLGL